MEANIKKCSSKEHENVNAIQYCYNCKIYLCKKCETYHSYLFQNHTLNKLDKDIIDSFSGYCTKNNHNEILEFFCKTHNELCCVSCLCSLKGKGKGEHSSCDVHYLEDIKELKKNKLKDNIIILEKLSIEMHESINKIKNAFNKINERKDNIKKKFMDIFTKLRNALNQREDEILTNIDNDFKKYFFDEELVKKAEKLPNKVKLSLEKGKLIDKEWNDDNKLNFIINDCINIENNIKDIILMNENIDKFKNSDKNIHIDDEDKNYDDEVNFLLDIMKNIFKNDTLNIYVKMKQLEQLKSDLKAREDQVYIGAFIFSKIDISKYDFAFLSRVDERFSFDTQGYPNLGKSPHLWKFEPNENQFFKIIKNNDETYFIQNKGSNYFIGMENEDGEWIFTSRRKGDNYQKFKFIHVENDYFLILNEKGKFIDFVDNEVKNGGIIKPNDKKNTLGQQWKLILK